MLPGFENPGAGTGIVGPQSIVYPVAAMQGLTEQITHGIGSFQPFAIKKYDCVPVKIHGPPSIIHQQIQKKTPSRTGMAFSLISYGSLIPFLFQCPNEYTSTDNRSNDISTCHDSFLN
jgi:hypothetical protein